MRSLFAIACWWVGRVGASVLVGILAAKVCSWAFCLVLSNYGGCSVPAAPAETVPVKPPVVISCSEACRYV